jgi:hypothetical protein
VLLSAGILATPLISLNLQAGTIISQKLAATVKLALVPDDMRNQLFEALSEYSALKKMNFYKTILVDCFGQISGFSDSQ